MKHELEKIESKKKLNFRKFEHAGEKEEAIFTLLRARN